MINNLATNDLMLPSNIIQTDIQNILITLCYFDLFKYPLTAKEIFERSSVPSLIKVEQILKELINSQIIYEHEVLLTQ